MSKFKVGDRVEIVYCASMPGCSCNGKYTGKQGLVAHPDYDYPSNWQLDFDTGNHHWEDRELKLVKEKNMADRFVRVKKDNFTFKAGAILKKDAENDYVAVSDLWDVIEDNHQHCISHVYVEAKENADWFERVYEVKVLGKAKYLAKEAARKAHDELYKEK